MHAYEEVKFGEVVDVKEENHDVLYDRRKRKEFEIFVGSLDKGTTEENLKISISFLQGEVTEFRIVKNPQTKKSKSYASLRFVYVD